MNYMQLDCRLEPLEPWRDILIAQLADAGFESFEETEYGFRGYIQADDFRQELLADALIVGTEQDEPLIAYELNQIGGQNWNKVWESNFEPVAVGNQLYIRAPFHVPSTEAELEIIIEPKMSFGTGHHETTYLMAQWLLETGLQGKAVLDMGCGTGILAILAARKGAGPVTAIDNYQYAYENTMENAARNDVGFIRVLHGDAALLGEESFDVIIANITKNVLLADMNAYTRVLNSEGLLFLSGFLEKDKKELVDHAASLGLSYQGEKKQKDWLAILLKKNI